MFRPAVRDYCSRMKDLQLLWKFDYSGSESGEPMVKEVFNGPRRRPVRVALAAGETLKRHHAAEPIAVLCVSGEGDFLAGTDLEDTVHLSPGTLLTLEQEIDHEVRAKSEMVLLVTKFKGA